MMKVALEGHLKTFFMERVQKCEKTELLSLLGPKSSINIVIYQKYLTVTQHP